MAGRSRSRGASRMHIDLALHVKASSVAWSSDVTGRVELELVPIVHAEFQEVNLFTAKKSIHTISYLVVVLLPERG